MKYLFALSVFVLCLAASSEAAECLHQRAGVDFTKKQEPLCGDAPGMKPCALPLLRHPSALSENPSLEDIECKNDQCECNFNSEEDGLEAQGCCPDPAYVCCDDGKYCAQTAGFCP